MSYSEKPLIFQCQDCRLIGIATLPETPLTTGLVIVVGGPQYRSGSHRQFTLLARDLAKAGIPSFRFDYRGMGDSEGQPRTFEALDDDLRSAIDIFSSECGNLENIVLWGLCDAASAILIYAHQDSRVKGIVLLNPWVHNSTSRAPRIQRNYYLLRLKQKSFWMKLANNKINLIQSAEDFIRTGFKLAHTKLSSIYQKNNTASHREDFVARMLMGLRGYEGIILTILSQNDYVADEFKDLISSNHNWRSSWLAKQVCQHEILEANHTFASEHWRRQVSLLTQRWLEMQFRTAVHLDKECKTLPCDRPVRPLKQGEG